MKILIFRYYYKRDNIIKFIKALVLLVLIILWGRKFIIKIRIIINIQKPKYCKESVEFFCHEQK